MKENFLPALKLTGICLILLSGIYTILLWGIAQFSSSNGNAEIIEYMPVSPLKSYGYKNLSQSFEDDKYFWPRPSAVNYNAAGSGGSNKGPSNPEYLQIIEARIDTFLAHNPGIIKSEIPAELITASGSGLDPDISPKGALVQVKRIAKARKIPESKLVELINRSIEKPLWNLFGPEKINVLRLNIELDKLNS